MPRRGQEGYTLLELTVVIMLLAILAAGIVLTGDLMGIRAASVARKLVADLRYAQQLANTSRVRHGIEVTNGTSYRVFRDDGGGGANVTNPMTGGPYIVTMTGDFNGVSLTTTLGGAPPKAQFDSVGRPFDGTGLAIGAGVNTVNIWASGAIVSTVTVEPNTGVVRVN